MVACLLLLVGCTSTTTTTTTPATTTTTTAATDPVAAYLPLITAGAAITTGSVIQFAENSNTQRVNLANQLYAVSSALESLTGTGTVPSTTQLNSTLASFNTNAVVSSQYQIFINAVSALFSSYLPKISGNAKYSDEVINALATGVNEGASTYASTPAPAATTTAQ